MRVGFGRAEGPESLQKNKELLWPEELNTRLWWVEKRMGTEEIDST